MMNKTKGIILLLTFFCNICHAQTWTVYTIVHTNDDAAATRECNSQAPLGVALTGTANRTASRSSCDNYFWSSGWRFQNVYLNSFLIYGTGVGVGVSLT